MGDERGLALDPGLAVVVGAGGGVGQALCERIEQHLPQLTLCRLGRRESVRLDLLDDDSLQQARDHVAALAAQQPLRLFIDATGYLHQGDWQPEKSWRTLERDHLMHQFAINTVGPALLMKHFLPLLPRQGKSVFATLSARVGSIGDNRLGGWYSYRASKAALNMMTEAAQEEANKSNSKIKFFALSPGVVDTNMQEDIRSAPENGFSLLGKFKGLKADNALSSPQEAAEKIIYLIDNGEQFEGVLQDVREF